MRLTYSMSAGAGGCVRLPRLIGFRKSLPFLASGQPVSGKRALELGMVDQLFHKTQSLSKSQSTSSGAFYDYQWLSGLLTCIEEQKIGVKSFVVVLKEGGATAVSAVVDVSQLANEISEEVMASSVDENWEECERKAEVKYPPLKGGHFRFFFNFLLNALLYSVTIVQLIRKIGLKMPAPFASLLTTFRCLYAGKWRQIMAVNAHGMSSLVITAESTALMLLFVLTRKLKKLAVSFGLKPSESSTSFRDLDCSVLVYLSKDLLHFSLPFIQSLLYSGVPTNVVVVDKAVVSSEVSPAIRCHFNYALNRGYISSHEVDQKMKLLSVCGEADVIKRVSSEGRSSVVVLSASCQKFSLEEVAKYFSKVYIVVIAHHSSEYTLILASHYFMHIFSSGMLHINLSFFLDCLFTTIAHRYRQMHTTVTLSLWSIHNIIISK